MPVWAFMVIGDDELDHRKLPGKARRQWHEADTFSS
jgi:hypothetical protein